MNRKITIGTTVALILFAALLSFTATYVYTTRSFQKQFDEYASDVEIFTKLYNFDKVVREEYIGDIDDDKLMDGILKGYMYGLGDQYGAYYTAEEYAALELANSGKMVGIGVTVTYDEENNAIEVVEVKEGSPALASGIEAGDKVISVDGKTVEELGYEAAVAAVSGTEGETVALGVVKGSTGITEQKLVVRAVISYKSVSHRVYRGYIGVVQISEFNTNTASEFKAAMAELREQGINSFIFDLRNDLGGDADAVCAVLDYILPEGPLAKFVDAYGKEIVISSGPSCLENSNICVLTNEYTASAAELFSAAIRDYKYGTLVGTTTYGKGTAQTVKKFSDSSGIRLSTEMYMPPNGENYEGVGVEPDITVEYEAGSDGGEDSQMSAAIENINQRLN